MPLHRLYRYKYSTLEQCYKYRIHVQPETGSAIDLIDPAAAEASAAAVPFAEEDRALLRLDDAGTGGRASNAAEVGAGALKAKRADEVRQGKSWLLRVRVVWRDAHRGRGGG